MKQREQGIYWIKYNNEWVLADWYPDVKCFIKHNGNYRFEMNEIEIGNKVPPPIN